MPGRKRCGFCRRPARQTRHAQPDRRRSDATTTTNARTLMPPPEGVALRAAFEATCLRGALPPVLLRAVCLVRAICFSGVWFDVCVWRSVARFSFFARASPSRSVARDGATTLCVRLALGRRRAREQTVQAATRRCDEANRASPRRAPSRTRGDLTRARQKQKKNKTVRQHTQQTEKQSNVWSRQRWKGSRKGRRQAPSQGVA